MKSIDELNNEIELEKCLLQTSAAENTYFTPFHRVGRWWYGAVRWYGKNNKVISFGRRLAKNPIWEIHKNNVARLPKNHKIVCQLRLHKKCLT